MHPDSRLRVGKSEPPLRYFSLGLLLTIASLQLWKPNCFPVFEIGFVLLAVFESISCDESLNFCGFLLSIF